MNPKMRVVEKSASKRPKKLTGKITGNSLPEEQRDGSSEGLQGGKPGNMAKDGKKRSPRGNASGSARLESQNLLKKSDPTKVEYFKDIVATIREPLVILDKDLRLLSVNRSFYKLFKVKPKETVGNLIYDLGNRQWDIPALRTLLETILPQKAVFNDYEVEHDFPSIGKRILLLNARRIPGPPKEALWILLAFEDVTERIRLERILQASEVRFRGAFETATDSMLLVDKTSGRVLDSNQAAQRTFSYSNQKLLKMSLWELDILKDHQQFEQISEELEKKGAVEILDKTVHTGGGGQLPADIYLMDRTGVIQCNIRGIAERKRVEEKMTTSENELHAMFAAMTDVVIVYDANGRYIKIAPTNPINLYHPQNVMLGKTVHEVLPKEQADFIVAKIREAIQTGKVIHSEYVLQMGGKEIWFAATASRLSENTAIWVAYDINERKQAENALRESEERFRTILDNIEDGYYEVDLKGNLTFVNRAYVKMLGYDENELIGMNYHQYMSHETAKVIFQTFNRVYRSGKPEQAFDLEWICKSGKRRSIEISVSIIKSADGSVVGFRGIVRDITERKRAEQVLSENEQRLSSIYDTVGDVIYYLAAEPEEQYHFISVNLAFLKVTGLSSGQVVGRKVSEVIPEPSLSMVLGKYRQAIKEKAIVRWEETSNYPTGRLTGEVSVAPVFDEAGNCTHLVGSVHDITERKRAEQTLTDERNLLRTLINNLPDYIYVKDSKGQFVLGNMAVARQVGFSSQDELVGKSDFDLFSHEAAAHYDTLEQEIIRSGLGVYDYEGPTIDASKEDKNRWVSTTKVPIRDAQGKVVWTVGIGRDVTERKRFESVQNAIYRITQTAITSEGIDALYHSIHSILGELIPAENFFIALYDPVKGLISFPYYIDQYNETPTGMTKIQGLTGYVIRTGRPLLATREIFDQLVDQGEVETVGTVGVDWMGAPLRVEGRMIGVIAVQSYTEGIRFKQEDLNLLEFVSSQVAQAIERKRMEEEIRTLSLNDELTGLYNRRGFNLLAEQEMKLTYRIKRSMMLFFCDVDDLKVINDIHGHARGDLALKEVAAILKETFREADLLARFGGDEFVVLAVDASKESADILANRIHATMERRNQQGDRSYQLTLSMGIAHYDPEVPCTLSELIIQADDRMYQQKPAKKVKK
jgi:diguanylate cyclase (GGDEF)-like protein/PAS domain S-box-containing protein